MISIQKLRRVVGGLSRGTSYRKLACLALALGLLAMPQGAWAVSDTWDGATPKAQACRRTRPRR